jgi:hypothetical protein
MSSLSRTHLATTCVSIDFGSIAMKVVKRFDDTTGKTAFRVIRNSRHICCSVHLVRLRG